MDIIPLIRELLMSHDCVVVPGFGGFLANYSPARVDKASSTLHPPRKVLSFNKNLVHNDGLLIGALAAKLDVGYGEARAIVEEQVQNYRQSIDAGQMVFFEGIGSFSGNGEGNLQFEPDMTINYLVSSFGLEPFRFDPLERYDVRERAIRPIDKEPVRPYSTRKIVWRAAVIVPIIALMVAVPFRKEIFKFDIQESSLNPLAKTELEKNRESLDEHASSTLETVVDLPANIDGTVPAESGLTPTASDEIISEATPARTYSVITGSFQVRQNALAQAAILRESGFDAGIIEADNGFYRVSAGNFDNIDAASAHRNALKEDFPGSWINKAD